VQAVDRRAAVKLKVFTLGMDDASGRFDESVIQEFLGDQDQPREVIEVSDHFLCTTSGRPGPC
jgi:hypothetical protein